MKNSMSYLNILWFAGLAIMAISVIYTLITDKSPLEAAGVSAKAATIGTLVLMGLLAFAPSIIRRLKQ